MRRKLIDLKTQRTALLEGAEALLRRASGRSTAPRWRRSPT